jgi:hypothetical protein
MCMSARHTPETQVWRRPVGIRAAHTLTCAWRQAEGDRKNASELVKDVLFAERDLDGMEMPPHISEAGMFDTSADDTGDASTAAAAASGTDDAIAQHLKRKAGAVAGGDSDQGESSEESLHFDPHSIMAQEKTLTAADVWAQVGVPSIVVCQVSWPARACKCLQPVAQQEGHERLADALHLHHGMQASRRAHTMRDGTRRQEHSIYLHRRGCCRRRLHSRERQGIPSMFVQRSDTH